MCSNPQKVANGIELTVACRKCNQCVAARRAEYIGRGMMERAMHKHCYVFALTYADEVLADKRASRFFNYSHVRAFIHRLNSAVRKIGASRGVRFMCAGEQGERNGRCHWHVVLFSDIDLLTVGTFQRMLDGKKKVVTDPFLILSSVGGDDRGKVRLNWSMWPHGFCVVQKGDQGGLTYALSYSLKDQFTVEKSADTMRHAKSERFATGLFRTSKRPAIGYPWLEQKFLRLDSQSCVLSSLDITVPDMSGYYHPSGTSRKWVLNRLAAIVWRVRADTGTNPPQFSSLMAILGPNDRVPFYDKETFQAFKTPKPENVLDTSAKSAARDRASRNCGSSIPCKECFRAKPDLAARFGFEAYERQTPDGAIEVEFFDAKGRSRDQAARFVGSENSECACKGAFFLSQYLSPCRE